MRGREMQHQYQQRRNIGSMGGIGSPQVNNFIATRPLGQDNADTFSSGGAQRDHRASPAPSPYIAQFVRSNYKKTGGPSLNDSLDRLKLDFMQGYNEVMQESDAAYRLDTLTQKKASQARAGGALAQMLQGGASAGMGGAASPAVELQLVKEENEALKKVIEQMKIDMQTIVEKVKTTFTEQQAQAGDRLGDEQKDRQLREAQSKILSKEE